MAMNPETNKMEALQVFTDAVVGKGFLPGQLARPDGTPVPEHWSIFHVDEEVVIKGYIFTIKYIGETSILLEPVRPAP